MVRSIASVCLCMASFGSLSFLPVPIASAQHLNLQPLAVARERADEGIGFSSSHEQPLPTVISARDSGATRSSPHTSTISDRLTRHRVENWLVVSALATCFTFGLVMTVSAIRTRPNEQPHRIL